MESGGKSKNKAKVKVMEDELGVERSRPSKAFKVLGRLSRKKEEPPHVLKAREDKEYLKKLDRQWLLLDVPDHVLKADWPFMSRGQLQEFKDAFRLFDREGTGFVGKEQLRSVMTQMGHTPMDEELQNIMEEVDIDRDGLIGFPEFLVMMKMREEDHVEGEPDKELMNVFKIFDTDNSGTISHSELANAFKVLGEAMTDQDIKDALDMADTSKDGEVNYREFLQMVLGRHDGGGEHAHRGYGKEFGYSFTSSVWQAAQGSDEREVAPHTATLDSLQTGELNSVLTQDLVTTQDLQDAATCRTGMQGMHSWNTQNTDLIQTGRRQGTASGALQGDRRGENAAIDGRLADMHLSGASPPVYHSGSNTFGGVAMGGFHMQGSLGVSSAYPHVRHGSSDLNAIHEGDSTDRSGHAPHQPAAGASTSHAAASASPSPGAGKRHRQHPGAGASQQMQAFQGLIRREFDVENNVPQMLPKKQSSFVPGNRQNSRSNRSNVRSPSLRGS